MVGAMSKVAVVGAGAVGTAIAYAAQIRGVSRELALFDLNADKVQVVHGAGGHAVDVGLHHHRVQRLVDPSAWGQDRGKNDPARSLGTASWMSPACVVNNRGRDPLRSVTRDSVRS